MLVPGFICALLCLIQPVYGTQTHIQHRPTLPVPTLSEVRDILARLQGPIISTLISRAALPASPDFYSDGGSTLLSFIRTKEVVARSTGKFAYGTLEYPFRIPSVAPDLTTPSRPFPGGIFHQDTFNPNSNISTFYIEILIPLIENANQAINNTSTFFHLSKSPTADDKDTKYSLDAQLLALLSHRASIGKVVAESKYASNITGYTPLIRSEDAGSLRMQLTNVTQEKLVLNSAFTSSSALAASWESAQTASPATSAAFVDAIRAAVTILFTELIDITTEVEVQYLLQRLN